MGWGDVQADASAQYSIRAHRAERGRCDWALSDGCSKAAPHGHSTALPPHDVSCRAKLKSQALAGRKHQEGRARGSLRRWAHHDAGGAASGVGRGAHHDD